MYVLDKTEFYQAMARSGFGSVRALADFLGVHRNTIQRYLSGGPVVSSTLERVFEVLNLRLEIAVVHAGRGQSSGFEYVAALVDKLHAWFPEVTFVLFGSRGRGRHARYADWDIGAYCSKGLPHSRYRSILLRLRDEEDSLPCYVDLVNLNRAGDEFLANISTSWTFLTGSQCDWLHLQRKVADGREGKTPRRR
jgi:hypothetical protein